MFPNPSSRNFRRANSLICFLVISERTYIKIANDWKTYFVTKWKTWELWKKRILCSLDNHQWCYITQDGPLLLSGVEVQSNLLRELRSFGFSLDSWSFFIFWLTERSEVNFTQINSIIIGPLRRPPWCHGGMHESSRYELHVPYLLQVCIIFGKVSTLSTLSTQVFSGESISANRIAHYKASVSFRSFIFLYLAWKLTRERGPWSNQNVKLIPRVSVISNIRKHTCIILQ